MRRRAFSLIELLVAIAIIGALVGTMTGFVLDLQRSRAALDRVAAQERTAGLLLDALERNLQTVLATGPGGRPGVVGDQASLRIATAGTPVRLAVPGETGGVAALGAVDWLDVRFDERRRRLELRREAARGQEPAGRDDAVLEATLFLVEFRFHDGADWRPSFDSRQAGLPVAVEVSIWFEPWPGAEPEEALDDPFGEVVEDDEGAAFDGPLADSFGDPFGDPFGEEERPRPDRRRIIPIPDGRAGEAAPGFGTDVLDGPEFVP